MPRIYYRDQLTRRKKYIDRSLVCLKEAIASGYKNLEHARRDPDLTALNGIEEFQKLVESSRESGK